MARMLQHMHEVYSRLTLLLIQCGHFRVIIINTTAGFLLDNPL
jgi:hypothetical protein